MTGTDIHDVIAAYHDESRFIDVAPLDNADNTEPASHEQHQRHAPQRLRQRQARPMVLMAIYDNLGKGASGAAVQNLNLMIGADEAASVNLAA